MAVHDPDVARLGDGLLDLPGLRLSVEVVLDGIADHEFLEFLRRKAGQFDIESAGIEFDQKVFQETHIPFAAYFVEGQVEGLLFRFVQVETHTGDLRQSQFFRRLDSLMPADHGPVLVDDDRIDDPELLHSPGQTIQGGAVDFSRIVRGGLQFSDADVLDFYHLPPVPHF